MCEIGEKENIHLSDLDEFLATRLLEGQQLVCLSIEKIDSQGNVRVEQKDINDEIGEGGIDFELSPSEYQSLDSINIIDFTNTTVYTTSSYEFFDFILMYFSSIECLVDFNGSSWRIRITKFKEIEGNS